MVRKGRQAVDRGREAFETARQSAAGQTAGGNGTTSDFGNQTRPGVSDFNTGTRTDRRRLDVRVRAESSAQRAETRVDSAALALCARASLL